MKHVSFSPLPDRRRAVAIGHGQQNWLHVGQDPGHSKYSTLDQINTGNVQKLQQAWTFHTGDKSGFFESTPLSSTARCTCRRRMACLPWIR